MRTNKPLIFTLFMIGFFSFISCGQNKKSEKQTINEMDNFKDSKTEEEWKHKLSPNQYHILREKGTERPFTGKWLMNEDKGIYKCAGCGNELFSDEMKFDAHCGWPSFDEEIAGGKIIKVVDRSLGMVRTEIVCANCGGHLGHLFDDGPTQSGLRYCVNSLSLDFEEAGHKSIITDTITLGGGCYWCIEAVFQLLEGVQFVESGFSGGNVKDPTYEQVVTGKTGHAEVVQIVFDVTKTSVLEILEVFFTVHDPTTLNRQGGDIGTQYRSVIYYRGEGQKKIAAETIEALNQEKVFENPVITEVSPFNEFYKAGEKHQDFYNKNKGNRYCQLVVLPKIEKFEKVFKERMKAN